MSEIEKLIQRLKSERDNCYRDSADSKLKADVIDNCVCKLELALENDNAMQPQ